ncbi:MAG: AlpA family phage regulatory protein [Gammaproteobacteria bacterium]|nr:AlpA family phage regulatory protein [Gammaproteobacteria bacterium]
MQSRNLRILREPATCNKVGRARSTVRKDIQKGVFPPPISLGPRCSGWPEHEVDAVLEARIAGKSEEEVHALVRRLIAARKTAA